MRADRGTSLIEAMVAMVILSCALIILVRSYVTTLAATGVQEKYVEALIILENELDAVTSKGFIKEMERISQKSSGNHDFEVRIKASPVAGRRIDEVTITVLWPPGIEHQRSVAVSTYLLDADSKDSVDEK
jgi:hypothetical protein